MNIARTFVVLAVVASTAAVLGSGRDAAAQGKKREEKEIATIGTVIITARPTRPSAVVELGKILPEIEISRVRQPFLSKIEEALSSDPF